MNDVVHRMNEEYRAWGALKSLQSNVGFRIAKKSRYERVIILMALYRADTGYEKC